MGSRQKETVVILAEDPFRGTELIDPGSFPQQADWWAEDNEDVFNTVIIPYYNGWEDNELSDAKEIIDNIPGNVTIGIMGHSGKNMGGYPITDIGSKKTQSFRIENIKDEVLNLKENLEKSDEDADMSPYQMLLGQKIKQGKENIVGQLSGYNDTKNSQTISGFIKSLEGHKDGKVKEVMFGSCRMGDREDLSILAEETGILVSGQSNTEWGTGAIAKTGDKPNQRFFVKGKTSVGIQFTPYRDFKVLETVSDTNNQKYIDTKRQTERRVSPVWPIYRTKEAPKTGMVPTQSWKEQVNTSEFDKVISSDIETIRENIDVSQFESLFTPGMGYNTNDYKQFVSDLRQTGMIEGPILEQESLENVLMGDFLSQEQIQSNILEMGDNGAPIPLREMTSDDLWEARADISESYHNAMGISGPIAERTSEAREIARETIDWSGNDPDVINTIMNDMMFGDEDILFSEE
jgi:hypothetical protein